MPENRLGMIVCGAFLGLIAAVVTAKLREAAPEPDKAVAAAESAVSSPKAVSAPMPPAADPVTPPAVPHPEGVSLPEPVISAPPHPPETHPQNSTFDPPAPIKLPEPQVALNDHHPVHSDEVTQAGVNLPAPANDKTPKPSATEQNSVPPPAPPGPMLEPPPPPPPAPSPPPFDDKKGKDERSNTDKNAAPMPLPHNNGASEPPLPGPPQLPGPPDPKQIDPPKPAVKIEAPPPAIVAPPAPEPAPIKVDPPPTPAPIKVDPPSTTPEPFAPKQDKVTVVIPANSQPMRVEPPTFGPPPASPSIAPPPPSGAPLVDSWDERTYVAKPGDTYAAISLSEYKTEDYAKALQMYNQNHPRAGDAMRRDGAMAPGDRIYLPPSPVLEKRHADVIVRSKPKPVTSGTVGGDGFGAVQADFRTQAAAPMNATYKVKGNGETLFQIAGQQLHDGNRWGEIAALNPRAPTDSNVLGGTILQMPAASAASTASPVPHP